MCCSLVASSLELFSVVYVMSPANEAIPAVGSSGCRESYLRADRIYTLLYSVAERRRSNFGQGIVLAYMCLLFSCVFTRAGECHTRVLPQTWPYGTRLHSLCPWQLWM